MKPAPAGADAFLVLLRAITGQEWRRVAKPRGVMKATKPKEKEHGKRKREG